MLRTFCRWFITVIDSQIYIWDVRGSLIICITPQFLFHTFLISGLAGFFSAPGYISSEAAHRTAPSHHEENCRWTSVQALWKAEEVWSNGFWGRSDHESMTDTFNIAGAIPMTKLVRVPYDLMLPCIVPVQRAWRVTLKISSSCVFLFLRVSKQFFYHYNPCCIVLKKNIFSFLKRIVKKN